MKQVMRVGQGFDVHAFCDGDALMIGGVAVPFDKAFKAHSDGDVLLHAICDALLGAAALGDIGRHFPDTDAEFRGIDSRTLLRRVVGLLDQRSLRCTNVDATVIAQAPRLAPYIDAMVRCIGEDLGLATDRVNVKATTSEWLGFCGRGEGIAAMATAMVVES